MKQVKLPKGKTFEFRAAGTTSKYAWDTFFNGELNQITRGTAPDGDYEVETDHMIPKLKTAARRRYKIIQVSRIDHNGEKLVDSLLLQARDMTPDEHTAEDVKRAEEKSARAEAKAAGEDTTTADAAQAEAA